MSSGFFDLIGQVAERQVKVKKEEQNDEGTNYEDKEKTEEQEQMDMKPKVKIEIQKTLIKFDLDASVERRAVYRLNYRLAELLHLNENKDGSDVFNYAAYFADGDKAKSEASLLRCYTKPAYVVTRSLAFMRTFVEWIKFDHVLYNSDVVIVFFAAVKYFQERIQIEKGYYRGISAINKANREIESMKARMKQFSESEAEQVDEEVKRKEGLKIGMRSDVIAMHRDPIDKKEFFKRIVCGALGVKYIHRINLADDDNNDDVDNNNNNNYYYYNTDYYDDGESKEPAKVPEGEFLFDDIENAAIPFIAVISDIQSLLRLHHRGSRFTKHDFFEQVVEKEDDSFFDVMPTLAIHGRTISQDVSVRLYYKVFIMLQLDLALS